MATTEEWIEELKSISVLELSERIKAIEETFGVSAAAPVAVAAAPRGRRRRRRRRRGRGADRVHRQPRRRRRQEDPGHQGRPRRHRPGPEGGQGAGRQRPEQRQGGRREGGGRPGQGPARGGRRDRHLSSAAGGEHPGANCRSRIGESADPADRVIRPAGRVTGLLAWAAVKRLGRAALAVLARRRPLGRSGARGRPQPGRRPHGRRRHVEPRRARPGPDGRHRRRGLRGPRPLDRAGRAAAARRLEIRLFDPGGAEGGLTELGLPTQHGVRMAELIHDLAPDARLVLVGYRTPEQFADAAAWVAQPGDPGREPLQLVPDAALRRHRRPPRARSTRRPRRACSGSTRPATTAAPLAGDGRRERHRPRHRPDGRHPAAAVARVDVPDGGGERVGRARRRRRRLAGGRAQRPGRPPQRDHPGHDRRRRGLPGRGHPGVGPAADVRPLLRDGRLRGRRGARGEHPHPGRRPPAP